MLMLQQLHTVMIPMMMMMMMMMLVVEQCERQVWQSLLFA